MAAQRSPHAAHRRRLAAALAGVALVATGCMTGQRPSFDDEVSAADDTGQADIDAVLDRLDATSLATFTADYEVTTKLGGLVSPARVVQSADSRRSITINDVRFVFDGQRIATCNLASAECEASINDARVSDVQLTHDFYADSFARRLRVDADRRVGEPTGYTITQAGQQALCVDVPVTGGTKSYCALESGPLARYDGADLFIELVAISDTPDETAFETN